MATRRTPETLTAVERAAALARHGTQLPALNMAPNKPPTSRTGAKNAAYNALVSANLNQVARPSRPAVPTPSLDPKADPDDSFSMLPINELEAYAHNPRTGRNPRYDDLRASIIADGITNPITVTRQNHGAKFHPYGGGNTRLTIAKELYEAGDSRFSHLKVIVKAWPGHANVISAHLAENENRGEISFWERAQGVADFKSQFEAEHRVALSTGELARELKSHGINFGVKVIQNFAFAVEHLKPLGQWLKAKEVNEVIRPGMTGVMAVAGKFDVATAVFEPVLHKHRDQMLTRLAAGDGKGGVDKETSEPDTKPVELDAAELVADLHQALATAVGVSPEVIPLMISAVESNSRITAEELRAIQIRKPIHPTSDVGSTARLPAPAPQQRALGGMLAGVPPAVAPPLAANPPAAPAPATNIHGSAAGTSLQASTTSPDRPATAPMDTSGPQAKRNPRLPDQVKEGDPTAHVLSLVLDISDLVVLHDCILHVPEMPFGYFMDLPVSLENVGDKTLTYPQLRAAAWKFLASLSGQVDPQWFTFADREQSRWASAALQGPDVFRQSYSDALRAFTAETGDPAMLLAEVYLMFNQPELGYLTVQLLRAMEQLRLDHPERFVRTVTTDPDLPD